MADATLTVATGRQIGTSASRRERNDRQIPGVVYGADKPSIAVSVHWRDLRSAMTTDAGTNALIELKVDGDTDHVIVREIQRHPVRRDVIHIDFMRIDPSKPVELEVAVILVGEAKQVTVNGGMTEQRINEIRVLARPNHIPGSIELDISEMTLDRSLLVSDLVLPDDVICLTDGHEAVVTAELTRASVMAHDAEGEGGDEGDVAGGGESEEA